MCHDSRERRGEGDHDRSGFMLLLQCGVTPELMFMFLWNDGLVTAGLPHYERVCVCVCPFERERKLKQNKWFEMVINISLLLVSTAQSFLRRAADSVSGVVDDGRREQKPTWAAPNCTAGTDAHTHTSTHTHSFMRLELLRTNGGWGKMSNKWPGTELNSGHWNN